MKKVILGFVAGALLATGGTVVASLVFDRVPATVKADYTVKLDGQDVVLEKAPLAYDGSAYLPLRKMAEIAGKHVDFQDSVIGLTTIVDEEKVAREAYLEEMNKHVSKWYDEKTKQQQIMKRKLLLAAGLETSTEEELVKFKSEEEKNMQAIDDAMDQLRDLLEQNPQYAEVEQ